jgi:hypothetical protein
MADATLKQEVAKQAVQASAANAQHTRSVTLATSAIVASVWTGLWGFDWAATHLSSDQLYQAIIIALSVGTALTTIVIGLTFWAINKAIQSNYDVEQKLKDLR